MSVPTLGAPPTHPQPAAWHAMRAVDVVRALDVDPEAGPTDDEAARRLAREGPNAIEAARRRPPWAILAGQFQSLLVWLLVGAAAVSALLREWTDAGAIVAIVLLNAILGFFQEYHAEQALAALAEMTAPRARVRRGGRSQVIPAHEVVPGDILELQAGDLVAADARMLRADRLRCVEAALTGESQPVSKRCEALAAARVPLAERANMVWMGTSVASGAGDAVVVATGMRTEFGRIAVMLEAAGEDTGTPLERRLESVGRTLVWASLGIVALIFLLGRLRGLPAFDLFLTSVGLAVAAVPEGLPAVVTIALAVGVQRMARRHALIRRLPAVETLGATSVICTDKTGTLTLGEMTVRRALAGETCFFVSAKGYAPHGILHPGANACLRELAEALVGCNDAALVETAGRWQAVGDPMEGALLAFGAIAGVSANELKTRLPRLATLPFDAERKRMTVIRRGGPAGYRALVKGAPEVILARCSHEATPEGPRPLDDARRAALMAEAAALADDALRVLAAARRDLADDPGLEPDAGAIEMGLVFLGLVGLQDPPRANAREAVARCRTAGIRTVMITGDHPATARAIARELGIARSKDETLTGLELDTLSDDALAERVERVAVYARVDAAHKLRIVRAWRSRGRVIAMTGDGVNDAPAIKGADVGVAMGHGGTEVTKQAADMVLADDDFATIVAAVEEGRGVYANIKKTLQYLLAGNLGELLLMTVAVAVGLPMPLLPVHLLWINLVTDGLPALALATDPLDTDAMARPPREPSAPILDRGFIGLMAFTGLMTASVSLGVYLYFLPRDLTLARTAAFATLVYAELLRAFGARSQDKPIWTLGWLSNTRLAAVIGLGLVIQPWMHPLPVVQRIFETAPMGRATQGVLVAVGAIPFLVLEAWKVSRSRWSPGTSGWGDTRPPRE